MDISLLNEILWRNQQQVLTPELILGITSAMTPPLPEDKSIAAQLGPNVQEYKGVEFRIEKFADIFDEIAAHHKAQWDEVEGVREELNPNYPYILASEQDGRYILFTARRDGNLIGNTGCYLYDSLHTSKLAAKEDTMYLIPEERKGLTAVKYFKYCEKVLLALGVEEITVQVKTTNRAHKLWERQGYIFSDRVLTKTFTQEK